MRVTPAGIVFCVSDRSGERKNGFMLRIRSTFAFLTVFAAGIAACVHPAGAAPGSCTEPVTLGTTISSTGGDAPTAAKWRDLTVEFARMINERGGIP
jgi:hypothetical protein